MKCKTLLFFCLSTALHAQLWSGVLSTSRAIDWTGVGAPIPTNWTQCVTTQCNTVSGGTVTATSINAALASAPNNTFVQLPSGSFTLTAMIDFASRSNVILRGQGANSTFITFGSGVGNTNCAGFGGANICIITANDGDGGDQTYNNLASWTGGYTVGTTSVTINSFTKGSIAGLQVGSLIFLDQLDNSTVPSTGWFVCQLANCSGGGSGNGRNWRPSTQEEAQIVTSISGSGPWTIGISPGIRAPNISSGKTPQMWSNSGLPVTMVGVENLSLDSRSNSAFSDIFMLDCYKCWVKGVRFVGPSTNTSGTYQVWAYQSKNVTVRDSYFYGSSSTSNNYALSNWGSVDNLFENNISQHVAFSNMQEGCIGCVQGYNFAIDDYYTGTGSSDPGWQQASSYHHGVGDGYILVEGNQGIGLTGDDVHGTSNAFTAFRNYWNGRDPNGGSSGGKTEQTNPILIYTYNRFWNIVGNVIGTLGYHNTYQCAYPSPSTCSNTTQIYSLGYLGDSPTNDAYTPTSLLRWGNYDTVTGAVRWCGNSSDTGWGTTCSSTSEIPTGLSDGFSNSVPTVGDTGAGQSALPASFYYSSKPSWWTSGIPWPANGPDVTGGNIANVGGHANNIPAANCYLNVMHGPTNGSATLQTFDASTCYSVVVSSTPSAGTLLKVNVQ